MNKYLLKATGVGALGGLRFGFDTAVISGAVSSIDINFVDPLHYGENARGWVSGLTVSSALFGCVIGGASAGWLGDKIGAKPVIFVGLLLMAGCNYTLYTGLQTSPAMLLPLYGLTGFTVGVVGCIPRVLVNLFPAQVRFSGVSFSYNLAYAIFGGLTPVMLSLLMKSNVQIPAQYVVVVSFIGMAAVLLAPKQASTA